MTAVDLTGTRTSRRWASRPGNFDAINARAVYASTNEWGIPDLAVTEGKPALLVSYSDRRACERAEPGTAVHFFEDDYRFETMWTQPARSLSRVQHAGAAIAPDFSLWPSMPMAMQLWQVYRSRWCGAHMAEHGIAVIPSVTWAGPDTYRFAFAGLSRGTTVALSTVGVLRDAGARRGFAFGFSALCEAVEPGGVVCYGRWPRETLSEPDGLAEHPARRF